MIKTTKELIADFKKKSQVNLEVSRAWAEKQFYGDNVGRMFPNVHNYKLTLPDGTTLEFAGFVYLPVSIPEGKKSVNIEIHRIGKVKVIRRQRV